MDPSNRWEPTWTRGSLACGRATDTERHAVHGISAYDYFSILKAVTKFDGTFLSAASLKSWKRIDFPLAFVAYGDTETIPWEEEGGD